MAGNRRIMIVVITADGTSPDDIVHARAWRDVPDGLVRVITRFLRNGVGAPADGLTTLGRFTAAEQATAGTYATLTGDLP
jgi:hypothetical protein